MAAERSLKELVEFVARTLVDDPSAVSVQVHPGPQGLVMELRVAPQDMGKVIGKAGRIARALRALVRAAALRHGGRAILDIKSSGQGD